jgi:hypothetical protein
VRVESRPAAERVTEISGSRGVWTGGRRVRSDDPRVPSVHDWRRRARSEWTVTRPGERATHRGGCRHCRAHRRRTRR